ncbi:bifunctional 5,10-methylenetetrahydrofolate dehydrogenase/5,10-methenyltetrahydrofolate cyclohydrolase [Patescibacteria group bacterium]|nr:bifunctional 5,10-methylenetetrahydrofolate dehydrogenase/5,10-methenyltetrahydrofolate cyclohydrolase [Patescibacteria group bacterium]
MILLDGKKLATEQHAELKLEVAKLRRKKITPGLAIIMVGATPDSRIYVEKKRQLCHKLGINFWLKDFPGRVSEAEILRAVAAFNRNKKVHGIIVQLPVPKKFDAVKLINAIHPLKDVDGLTAENLGLLELGQPRFIPATALGIWQLIEKYHITLKGKDVTVVGFGKVAGMPISILLANLKSSVTILNESTKNLKNKTVLADILITAAGVPHLIKGKMIKKGAVVIDAGINKLGKHWVGDVNFADAAKRASHITPVPGGVGPLTVSALINNVVQAAKILSSRS